MNVEDIFIGSVGVMNEYVARHSTDTIFFSVNVVNAFKDILSDTGVVVELFGSPSGFSSGFLVRLFGEMVNEYVELCNDELSRLVDSFMVGTGLCDGDCLVLAEQCFNESVGFVRLFQTVFLKVLFRLYSLYFVV